MAESYAVTIPKIETASFSINPAVINQSIVLVVTVTEATVYQNAEIRYSGEFYSGEV